MEEDGKLHEVASGTAGSFVYDLDDGVGLTISFVYHKSSAPRRRFLDTNPHVSSIPVLCRPSRIENCDISGIELRSIDSVSVDGEFQKVQDIEIEQGSRNSRDADWEPILHLKYKKWLGTRVNLEKFSGTRSGTGLTLSLELRVKLNYVSYSARPHLVMRADGHLHEVATPEPYSFPYDPDSGIELKIIFVRKSFLNSYHTLCKPRLYKPDIVDNEVINDDNRDGDLLRLIELKNTIQSVFVTSEQKFLPVDKNRIRIDVADMKFVFTSKTVEYVTKFEYTVPYELYTRGDEYYYSLSKRVKLKFVSLAESLSAELDLAASKLVALHKPEHDDDL
tara:strand:+ start:82 stop:1086 length:1005 start_codon:yes stop_codon:yes gene_type:complete